MMGLLPMLFFSGDIDNEGYQVQAAARTMAMGSAVVLAKCRSPCN
jgi:hypothetical protein